MAEKQALDRETEEALQDAVLVMLEVHEKHGLGIPKEPIIDDMRCVRCAAGAIRYQISAQNGHIRACCSTKGCVAFMQ